MGLKDLNNKLNAYKTAQKQARQTQLAQQPKSDINPVRETDWSLTPVLASLVNGYNELHRAPLHAAGSLAYNAGQWGGKAVQGLADTVSDYMTNEAQVQRYNDIIENAKAEGNTNLWSAMASTEDFRNAHKVSDERMQMAQNVSDWGKEAAKPIAELGQTAERGIMNFANDVVPNVPWSRAESGSSEKFAADIAQNAPQLAQSVVASAVFRHPAASTAIMATNIYGQTYGDLRAKGFNPESASVAALVNAAAQTPLESIPVARIAKAFPSFGAKLAKGSANQRKIFYDILATAGEEGITEFLQNYADASVEDIAKAYSEGRLGKDFRNIAYENTLGSKAGKNFDDAVYAGALGAVMGGGMHGIGSAANYAAQKLSTPNQKMIEEAIAEEEARVAAERAQEENGGNGGNANLHPNANAVAQFFINKGESPIVAAAIAGNVFQESGYDPMIENSIGAYGAFQYLGDRRDALLSFAEANNLDPSDLNTQLEFAWYEMNQEGTLENQALQEMRKAQTPEEAAVIFRRLFERPGEEEANDAARMEEARRVHDNFADAKAYIEDYAQTMDLTSLEDEELQRTLNEIANEGTEEEVIQKAKELGYQPKVEETQETPTEAPKEAPKPTERPQGAAQVSKIETPKEAVQEAEMPTVEPIQGKPYHINNSTPTIKRDAGKGNFNNKGSYNGRLAPQNTTTAQTVGLPLTQPTQAIPQGENTNGENLQTQTAKRGENRENLDVNAEPKQAFQSEGNENATHPQGNEVTPTLAPSSRGVSNIAQNTPKTASDGNTLTADKVDGKALEKATAATTDTVSAKSETSEAKAKENAVLDSDSTVSMAKKIADERAQAVEDGKETKAVAKKKLDDVEKKVKSRLDERLAKGEISKATHDKLADRAEDIKEDALNRIEQTEVAKEGAAETKPQSAKDFLKEHIIVGTIAPTATKDETATKPKKEETETAKKSNKKTTQKTKDNDIIKKDNSEVKAKEETENVSERSEGLGGAVGVGRPRSGESEGKGSGDDAGRDSGNTNRSGRRELRHDSGIDEQADKGRISGDGSGTKTSTVDERNDSKGNAERGTEVPVISKKADKIEADIAKGKVKDPRDTQGNNYVPKDTKTESRSPKKRYQANVEAIKLLKKLEAENRKATPAEQEILAGYSGWGGLSFAFNNTSPQYDEAANAELRELLTDVEYNDANGEVISAFYTPPFVINAMWNIATRLGFKGGRILDPGCGIANFFTYMPADVQGNSTAMQGVEKSALPARIAAQLFQGQKFKINNTSYESMKTGNDFYDLAITNVPFASNVFPLDNSVKGKWNLHNYYFLKTLQKVRPNGLIIFMTSSNTMDASDSASVRRELSKNTELLGAIRLPTNLFGSAGAKVTTDIIVLRKLGENETNTERWGNAAKSANPGERGIADDTSRWEAAKDLDHWVYANNYWNEHPENVVGKVTQHRDRYGRNAAFVETVSEDETRLLLRKAIESLPENVYVPRVPKQLNTKERVQQTLQPVSGRTVGDIVKMDDGKYGHVIVDNDTGSIFATPYEDSKQARIAAFMDVANTQSELMIAEVNGETTNEELDTLRQKLNKTYDAFVKKYGYLNDGTTAALVNEFPQVGRVLALENYKTGDGKKKSATATKADIFEKRVSFPAGYGVKVENAADALVASIQKFGYMDIPYMANELGVSEENIISELGDKIIKDPADERYVTMDEYLSGNVRVKLAIAEDAAETDPSLKRNVEALKAVIPKDVEIKDIDTPLGTPIVSPEDTQAFLEDLLGERESIEVSFNPTAGTWAVAKGRRYGSVPYSVSDREYGIPSINGNEKGLTVIDIVDAMLNDKDLSKREIFKNKNDDTPKMRDEREAAKQQEQNIREKIGQKFKEWIMANDEVSKTVKQAYNNKFNAFVTRKYDGSILDVKPTLHNLYPHQADAVFRIVSSKTTLLNHCVGSGKSLTMQSAGMELKRMGLANKIVYTLPKNVVTQFAREFYQDFPNARILVLSAETLPRAPKTITYDMVSKKDENGKPVKGINGEVVLEKVPTSEQEQARRRAIMARRNATLQKIKTNDWDAIIMSHTTFENVPVSDHYKLEFLNAEVDKYRAALEEERFKNMNRGKATQTEKKLQESLERYERMIEEMLEGKENYDLGEETFETLGIDHLFVDESDLFKNLGFVTNLSGVKGISTTGSMRAMDMFMKTKYLQEDTTTHGVTFATGTPISNSISELYTLCRYMAQRELDRLGINNFDQFAKLFVNIGQGEEPKTDGSGYDFKTKVIGIRNAPECIRIVSQFMDTKTVDDLPYIQAARPNANYKPVVIKEPNALKEFKQGLNARIATFRGKFTPKVTSYSKESLKHFAETGEYLSVQDGFLKLVGDFRAITLCPYIVDKRLRGEEAFGKVWKCADNVYEEYLNSKDRKGAQVVFCDYSTPTKGEWSVYEELKNRLIEKGIPAKEIAFVHDAGTSDKKQAEIFNKVNEGTIRVIIGSTGKMGAGTNMQKKLVALHHLDVPWRPRDIEQREGRILRNGNENKDVNIYTYMTEGSYDMNLWNLLNSKQITINQAIHGDEAIRSADTEGIDENNFKSYEILANNDPNQKLYIQKTAELRRLEAQKNSFDSAKVAAENVLNTYPQKVERAKASLSDAQADAKYAETINKQFTINIGGKSYTRDEANEIFNKKKEVIAAKLAKELKENGNNAYLEEQQIATIGKAKVFVSGDTPEFRKFPASENTAVFVRLNLEYGAGTPTAIGAYNTVVGAPSKTLGELQDTIYSCQKEITLAKETLTKTFDKTEELAALKEEVANLKSLIDGAKAKEASTTETEPVKESTVGNIGEKLRHEATLISENELTEREQGIVAFANKMGVKVQFFDGNKNLHGWQQGDVVFLNRNSAKDLNFVFWHEVFHWLAKNNPELYEKIKKAVLQNDDIAAQIEAYIEETGRTDLTVEAAIEEMLADAMSEASKRGSFFETLGVTHPTLVQKIIKWMKNIYNDFVAQYRRTKGFRAEAGLTNTQIKRMSVALDGMALKLKDGQGNRLFRADGKGNLVSVGVKDVAYVDGVKYSVTNRNVQAEDRVKVTHINTSTSEESVGKRINRVTKEVLNKTFTLEDSGIELIATNVKGAKHFVGGNPKDIYNKLKQRISSSSKTLEELVRNSVYIETEPVVHKGKENRDFIKAYAAVEIEGRLYRFEVGAKKLRDGKFEVTEADLYNLTQVEEENSSAQEKNITQLALRTNNTRGKLMSLRRYDTVSVADLLNNVKDRDGNLYVKDGKLQYDPGITPVSKESRDKVIGEQVAGLLRSAGIVTITDGKKFNSTLADVQKAEAKVAKKNKSEPLTDESGKTYGFVKDGRVYLNAAEMQVDTPIHEYTHVWDGVVQRDNPELWNKGVELMKQTSVWEEVVNDPAYANIKNDPNLIASEVHARLVAMQGKAALETVTAPKGVLPTLKRWLSDFWASLKDTFSKWSEADLNALTVEEFIAMPIRDLAEGKKIEAAKNNVVQKSEERAATGVQNVPTKYSINLKDLSDGKVFTDEKLNAANDTILQKMVIGNTTETKSFIDKYVGKRALPPLNPKIQYDEKAVNSKENLFRDHFSFTLLGAIRSVSRYKDAIVKQVFDWADTAKRQQAKLYAKWTVAHKEILDLIQDPKDYEMYTAILLDEDASRKVLTDDVLRERGASENVIKAHKLIRKLLKDIRSEVSKVYTAERAETKNFTSQAEAEAWAKTPFFRNVDIKRIKKTNGVVWQVKYLTPQYETNQARMTVEELEGLKGNGDIKIISESLVDPNNPNYYDVEYMRPVRSLADLDFYIPHFFHDFLIIQTKKTKNGEEIKSVVGSGTSLEEAVERANALAEKAGENVSFEIAPKALACEDETSPAVVVGDKEYGMLTNSIKEGLSISLQEAQDALAARTTNRHVFLSALQHRKGAKGWETNMRWVIQHHIATSSRYCGLEPFKSKAINLFERRFGAFGDDYFTKSPRANFVQGYINSVLGRPSKMENFVNAMLNHLPGFKNVPRPSRAVTSTILGAMSVFKLGVSPAAAVVNMTQLFNVQAYIGVQWTKEGMARAWKLSEADKKLLEDLGTREETGLETVDVDEDTALVAGKYATQLKALRNAADKAMWAFTKTEAFLRKTAVLGAYHKAIAEGKTEGAARAYALEVNRKANFDYGIADAPGVFRATKGSIIGDLFLQFKKYGIKELEVIGDMLTNKNIPKSQRLAFFGEFFLLGGLFNSVPFQEVIVALIGMALDTDDPEAELKKWLMQKAGESEAAREAVLVGMYGAGALIGVDISQRVGFRTLVPEFDEPLGVTGSTAKQIVTAMANGDPIGFAKAVSPAAGNIASATVGHNTDSKGRVSYVYENPGERVLRLCGFRTIGEALSVDTSRIITEGRNKRAKERKEAKEEYFKNPSRENKQRLKNLGYTDGQIKNLKPDDKTADRKTRLKNNMTKQELKDYDSILKW